MSDLPHLLKLRGERTTWGKWGLHDNRFLVYAPNDYYVDLHECVDSASFLDWLVQLSGKTWATAEDLGDLLRAFDDIFHLQQTVCGQGIDHTIIPEVVLCERGAATSKSEQ